MLTARLEEMILMYIDMLQNVLAIAGLSALMLGLAQLKAVLRAAI